MLKKISFKNKRGLILRGLVHIPDFFNTAIVFCHGFPSSNNGYTSRRIGPALEEAGFLVLRFNFSHTPPSEGKFEDKLMSCEVEDIRSAIDYLCKHFKFKHLVLIGHSTGAIDVSLYAKSDKRIDKIILTGAISNLKNAVRYDFTDEQIYDFWTKGYIVYHRVGKWVDGKKLKKCFYDEFFSLDILNSIKRYKRPILIIHGEKDSIPWNLEAHKLYMLANRPKRFVLINGADHSFTNPKHWRQVIDHMIRFIRK